MSLTREEVCYISEVIFYLDLNRTIEELPAEGGTRRFRATSPKLTKEILESIQDHCRCEENDCD